MTTPTPDASAAAVKLRMPNGDTLTRDGKYWHSVSTGGRFATNVTEDELIEYYGFDAVTKAFVTASHAQLVETVERLTRELQSSHLEVTQLRDAEETAIRRAEAAESEVERLTRERDAFDRSATAWAHQAAEIYGELKTAEAAAARLRDALERAAWALDSADMTVAASLARAALASAAPPDARKADEWLRNGVVVAACKWNDIVPTALQPSVFDIILANQALVDAIKAYRDGARGDYEHLRVKTKHRMMNPGAIEAGIRKLAEQSDDPGTRELAQEMLHAWQKVAPPDGKESE